MKLLAACLLLPSLANAATVCKFKDDQGGNLKIEWKETIPGGSKHSWNRYSYQLVQVTGELGGYTYAEPAVAEHRSISTRCGGESHSSFFLHNGYEVYLKSGDSMCGFRQESASLIDPNHKAVPLECHTEVQETQ